MSKVGIVSLVAWILVGLGVGFLGLCLLGYVLIGLAKYLSDDEHVDL